jgi:MoaA/NifB/PqqE/SkfB family radical SAM enzyme
MSKPIEKSIVLKGYHYAQSVYDECPDSGVVYLALNFTSDCNYACPYCFVCKQDLNVEATNSLSLERIKSILDEAKKLGARTFVVPGRGEPFCDKNIMEIIDYAKSLNLNSVIYTNGSLLDFEKIKKLKESSVSLYLSVDSFVPEIYEEMVGFKGSYPAFKRNLEMLLRDFHIQELVDGKIVSNLGINSVITKQTAGSIEEIHKFCEANRIFHTCRSAVKVGEANKNWELIAGSDVEGLRDIGKKFSTRNFTSATPIGQCGLYRYGLTIDNDGEILVCADARENFGRIGNVKENSVSELIEIKNKVFPLNSKPGYCFVKSHRNPESY